MLLRFRERLGSALPALVLLLLLALPGAAPAEEEDEERSPAPALPAAGARMASFRVTPTFTGVASFRDLAEREARRPPFKGRLYPQVIREGREPLEPEVDARTLEPVTLPAQIERTLVGSPGPANSFIGLDDIAKMGTGGVVIPPDVDGAVGHNRLFETLNNNYRLHDKTTGADLGTVSIDSFWAGTGASGIFDPKTLYDPYNDRWIMVAVTNSFSATSSIVVAVSQTSDPAGAYYLGRFDVDASDLNWADFPCLGFSKNWVAVNVNLFTNSGGSYSSSRCLVINYPQMRSGTFAGTFFTSGFCSNPATTYSATEDTLFVPTHVSSGSPGTYRLDKITGTAGAPVYTTGSNKSRALNWSAPGGNSVPQAAPLAGTSSCGATPCKIDAGDSYLRSGSVFRNGLVYYVQTVTPTGGSSHTAIQWTALNATTGNIADGGRLDDAGASATNGGKWYTYPSIAVAVNGDFVIGFTQASSAQYPTAGYAVHLAADGVGTLRDAFPLKLGEDYYHKDYGTGRNRWGDYTRAQVDPSDDRSLWVLSEYARARQGSIDDTSIANSSRWGTWWGVVGGSVLPVATVDPGPSQAEGNAGLTPFTFTVHLSSEYGAPVSVSYQVNDGTATLANNDYQTTGSSVFFPSGTTTGTITVNVVGDLASEASETFSVQLTGAINATLGGATVGGATIVNDDDAPPSAQVTFPNGGEQLATTGTAHLTWNAADDMAVTGVDVRLSRTGAGGPFEDIALAQPNTGAYDWTVTGPATADAWLQVTAHDAGGHATADVSDLAWSIVDVSSVSVKDGLPSDFGLRALRPNPTTGSTSIVYDLPREAVVRLSILDLQGRTIATLVDGETAAGRHTARWTGLGPAGPARAGLYFVRYRFPGRAEVRRLLVTR